MFEILNTTSTLFITILLGFIAGRAKIFKPGSDHTLINYVFYIALPLNLFLSCYKAPWNIFNGKYLSSYIIAMLVIISLTYIFSHIYLKCKHQESIINSLITSQVDGAYFTMPLFLLLFKSYSYAVPLMLFQNIVFFTLSLVLLEVSFDKTQGKNIVVFIFKRISHVLLHNPLISMSILGLVLNYFEVPIPAIVIKNIKFIGETSSAVALFSLGLTCAFCIKKVSNPKKLLPILYFSSIKLLLFPFVTLIIGILLACNHEYLLALVLLTGSPAATHTYIIANKYEIDVEIATFSVVITTILSFITIHLWLYFLT